MVGPLNSGTGSRALLGIRVDGPALVPVVLLPVPRKTLDDPEALLRLRKETDRAVGLDHPSILKVLGLVQIKRGLARATAFANGEPVRRILTRAVRLTPGMAARVVVDAATGVHYAHLAANEEGIPLVHGDIRPETLMSSYSGLTMVTGYGALTVAPTEAGGKRVPGRRKYSAPEQILGGRTASTPQTDVYLLGLVLWEALTGQIPFQDAVDPDKAIVGAELPLNSPRIPEKLRPVLEKAIAKKGTDRYPTALALREAIEGAIELATQAQYAEWLAQQFVGDPIALAQRKLVEQALEQAEGLARTPPPLPQPAASPAAAAAAPAQVAAPQRPRPPASAPSGRRPVAADAARAPLWPFAATAVACLALGAAGGWLARDMQPPPQAVVDYGATRPHAPLTVEVQKPADMPSALEPLSPTPTPAPVDPAAQPPAGTEPAGAKQPEPAAPPVAPTPLAPTPTATPTPNPQRTPPAVAAGTRVPNDGEAAPGENVAAMPGLVMPSLEVFSVPEVDVLLGTRSLGRTPTKSTVLAGKQKLTLVNASMSIRVTREVEVNPTGTTHADVRIGVGSIGFHAPTGAKVSLDKRVLGIAPLEKRFNVYEGTHHAVVEVDGQRWEESFEVTDGDWLSYTARPGDRTGARLRFTKDVSAGTKPEIAIP
ncbi:MAG TPA: protein kinase [Myxococcales bacterium]